MQTVKTDPEKDHLLISFIKRLFKYKIFEQSSTLSYYFLFSFFPFLMLVATSLSNFEIPNESIYNILINMMPEKLTRTIISFYDELKNSTSSALLFFSLGLTLYSLLKAVSSLKEKIRMIFDIKKKRSFFSDIMLEVLFVLLLIIAFYATLIIIVAGKRIFIFLRRYASGAEIDITLFSILRIVFTVCLLLFLTYGIYRILPGEKYTARDIMPGAFLATSVWIFSSYLFAFYVDNMNGFSLVYGSLGAIIILMAWLYLINFAILLGAHLNAFLKNEK